MATNTLNITPEELKKLREGYGKEPQQNIPPTPPGESRAEELRRRQRERYNYTPETLNRRMTI